METFMATSILNRDLPLADVSYPIPAQGQHYVPLPDRERDGRTTASAVQTILANPLALYLTPKHNGITHWVMGNPDDQHATRIEFDSQMVDDIPGEKISWRSLTP